MNLERAFNFIEIKETQEISEFDLVRMIRKRLIQLHDLYIWTKLSNIPQLYKMYMETMPYFLLLGRHLNIQPKRLKVDLDATFFDQDVSGNLAHLNRECSTVFDGPNIQSKYETIILGYLRFGLYLGLTPKRIEKELIKRNDITHSLEFELYNHFIRNNFIIQAIEEKRG